VEENKRRDTKNKSVNARSGPVKRNLKENSKHKAPKDRGKWTKPVLGKSRGASETNKPTSMMRSNAMSPWGDGDNCGC
jgi:hypothetical protein